MKYRLTQWVASWKARDSKRGGKPCRRLDVAIVEHRLEKKKKVRKALKKEASGRKLLRRAMRCRRLAFQ